MAGELAWSTTRSLELSSGLAECKRVVAVTVHLPELLLDAAGLLQRFGAAGVPVEVLVAAESGRAEDEAAEEGLAELRSAGLRRHRLALPDPFGSDREDDVVAALSELVGFDPEPGVYCLAPVADGRDSSREIVSAAARRITWVYGMTLVRYSALSDDATIDLELDSEERTRKHAGLASCASQFAALGSAREYFIVEPASPRPL